MRNAIPGVTALCLVLLTLSAQPVAAYIGPGSGLSAIGAVLAVIAGLFVAIFGFVWYPIKRLLRSFRKSSEPPAAVQPDGSPPE